MDSSEMIQKVQEFLEKTQLEKLLEQVRLGENFLVVDFSELAKFDLELADLLLDQPDDVFKAGEIAVSQLDLGKEVNNFALRFVNLPHSAELMIRNIRSVHLKKLFSFEGVVRQKSDVRPQVVAARFECPSCGNILPVLQLDNKFKEPSRCSCGRKGKFRLLSKELVDAQGLVLEEIPEKLEGGEQPKRMNVFLKNDLVSPIGEKKTNPGTKIRVVGVIKEVPIITKSGVQSTRFDLLIEANSIETIEEDFSDITINEEELARIKELAKDPFVVQKIVKSIAPSIYGHEKIKESLILMLVGGVRKVRGDGVVSRGDIHILLVGDPGAGKSQLLKRATFVAPKARYVTGKGASGAGLTASVVKDEFLQGWSLEAGALVLANKGLCCIDELDKMSREDTWAMHEALEQQSVTISKANIQATLRAETTVLAAANPKYGRFDPYDTVANQINLPPTLINRFDLIFPIKDLPEIRKDERTARFILELHKNDVEEPEIDTNLLRKYFAFARQNIRPVLTDEAINFLQDYYIKMRTQAVNQGAKSVPISPRQLEGLVRLSEASAKLRLSSEVTKQDAERAITLLDFCLKQVAFDEESGTFDIDRIASEIPASQRNKLILVKEIIAELENKLGKTIPIEDIIKAAEEKGLGESETEEVIQKLKRGGDIFEPRRGFISRI
ncbi:AAA family ATPase [Candidatus Woesearchaeota archaeon]|nr:MAG: AAA family ATPase [Candidatus Woesearchaeota archaeon]